MPENKAWTLRDISFASLAVAFVLFVYGAVPLLMLPTLAQAVWTTGFSESLANGPLFNFHAHGFGIPEPAAIAFGLAGAWPASLLIRLGLHPADAYTGMTAIWLSLAVFSAYQIVRRLGATRSISLLGAVTWMSAPIIWAHAGYSMMSLGIALLSFYFMVALRLFLIEPDAKRIAPAAIILYFTATIVAVFMDGYTFMMFAVGSSILLFYSLITRPEVRRVLVKVAVPVHMASFALAYLLFTTYIGKLGFEAHRMDFFRGWGLDLSYLVIPTNGVLWLPDLLGFSLKRTDELHFGNASVWATTFALPVLLLGVLAWWRARRHIKVSTAVLLIAMFGFYMALGPSLKINSTKPESLQISHPRQQSALMPSEYAVMPTGSAWISENLPGFNVMRASYRWSALGIFALWLLIMLKISRADKDNGRIWLLGLFVVILFNLPDFQKRWPASIDNREMFQQIDRELVAELRQHIRPGETVAFIPWGNDFLANYLAPKVGFRTFNIGGDKNLAAAQVGWPAKMLALGWEIDPDDEFTAVEMLIDGTADVLILPYFDMLWSAHRWPHPEQVLIERRAELKHVVLALRDLPYLEVFESALFTAVRLRPEFSGEANRPALVSFILGRIHYPIALRTGSMDASYLLQDGWHSLEAHHVWSEAVAKLMLPVPKECGSKRCDAVLQFVVHGASPRRPVSVLFNSVDRDWQWSRKVLASTGGLIQIKIPLTGHKIGWQEISISVPDATSPLLLSDSPDDRVLGISLQRIDLLTK